MVQLEVNWCHIVISKELVEEKKMKHALHSKSIITGCYHGLIYSIAGCITGQLHNSESCHTQGVIIRVNSIHVYFLIRCTQHIIYICLRNANMYHIF